MSWKINVHTWNLWYNDIIENYEKTYEASDWLRGFYYCPIKPKCTICVLILLTNVIYWYYQKYEKRCHHWRLQYGTGGPLVYYYIINKYNNSGGKILGIPFLVLVYCYFLSNEKKRDRQYLWTWRQRYHRKKSGWIKNWQY